MYALIKGEKKGFKAKAKLSKAIFIEFSYIIHTCVMGDKNDDRNKSK